MYESAWWGRGGGLPITSMILSTEEEMTEWIRTICIWFEKGWHTYIYYTWFRVSFYFPPLHGWNIADTVKNTTINQSINQSIFYLLPSILHQTEKTKKVTLIHCCRLTWAWLIFDLRRKLGTKTGRQNLAAWPLAHILRTNAGCCEWNGE